VIAGILPATGCRAEALVLVTVISGNLLEQPRAEMPGDSEAGTRMSLSKLAALLAGVPAPAS
jgi:hypothetical protein